ncbi:hypothetical protein B0H34DRAFT_692587 [Crassisporium funariophilum]|nr:hypothetical protein B0H34DRAFT_692587 [Crassisporium funariophilum]
MLDGSYLALVAKNNEERDIVLYVPRLPEHCGPASLPSVVFSVAGTPGPYLKELIRGKVTLDGAHDTIFEEHGWRRASLIVDWPGVTSSVEYHPCADKNHHFTRTEIAQIVANSIADIITTGKTGKSLKWGPQVIDRQTQPWDLRNIDYRDVRLIAINYYRKAWVPVLAIDA